MLSVPEILDKKRAGLNLSGAAIEHFIQGVADGGVTDAQIGAFTMAVKYNGMNTAEQTGLTLAMRDSGTVLQWPDLPGPVLDKHSTGGVGDWVSLALAPAIAAAGGFVPMISGRGLGHTGGTLDKLESIPGFSVQQELAALRQLVRKNGMAMIGQGPELAPADGRIYAIRDVTGTVESIPLIVASILAKKLAEGLDGLVLDVKTGNGAFMPALDKSLRLAQELVATANGSGTACCALITDMNQSLSWSAGNALEVKDAIDFVTGRRQHPQMNQVISGLYTQMLLLGGLAETEQQVMDKLQNDLASGRIAEKFGIMVAAQGGPADLVEQPDKYLATATLIRPVPAPADGWVAKIDTRGIGITVLRLGGGRVSVGDTIDPAVGLSEIVSIGERVIAGQPLALVHAQTQEKSDKAIARVLEAIQINEAPCAALPAIYQIIEADSGT